MKKLVIVFAFLLMISFVLGCGKTEKTEEPSYADQSFISALSKALESRWKKSEEEHDPDSPDFLRELVQIELNALSKYENEPFEDSKLKEKALSYINCLKQQDEALSYANVDSEKYSELWSEAYNNRTKLITEFVNDYGLSVSEKYQSTLSDMITNAKVLQEKEEDKDKISAIIDSISFEVVEDSYGYKTYESIIENTTGKDIDWISFTINLLDEDGIIVETEYDSVNNLRNGQKAKIQFMTDTQFKSTEITADVNYSK